MRACDGTDVFPPDEAVHRLLYACQHHSDYDSLGKLQRLLEKTGATKTSDTFALLNDCYKYVPTQTLDTEEPKP